jgi:hypothetical protein
MRIKDAYQSFVSGYAFRRTASVGLSVAPLGAATKENKGMNRASRWFAAMVIIFSASAFSNLHAAGKQTFTGEVSDAMCGKQHMESTPALCTRDCVSKGSKFALIVGDKVYILDTTDKTALATLDKQAGKNAAVTGTLNGDTIEVSAVAAAK